jgi:hypothetical protein
MKNAFLRIGYTCASLLVAGGFMTAVTAKAEMHDLAYVTLAQPVVVGNTTLPGGHYTITSEGDNVFLIRSDNGENEALVVGRHVETNDAAPKTEVVLKNDGESLRLDQLRFEGENSGIEFNHR